MRIAMSLALALFLLPAAACGGDDDDDTGDDQSTGIDAGDDGTEIDAGGEPDAGSGEPDAGSDADGAVVRLCGGFAGIECNDDEYCDYEADDCGGSDTTGLCQPRPAECEPDEVTVCGCDGEPYDNKCLAAQAGTDVAEIGLCQ